MNAGRQPDFFFRLLDGFHRVTERNFRCQVKGQRRRRELSLGVDVFEIKLGDKYLMSSLFTASEIALARLGLAELSAADLDVVVGGLGLGYTAQAVLEHKAVKSLVIVEALDAVIFEYCNWESSVDMKAAEG